MTEDSEGCDRSIDTQTREADLRSRTMNSEVSL